MDIWSDNQADSPASRSAALGSSSIGNVCTSNKYSIVEDNGGFTSVLVIQFSYILLVFDSNISISYLKDGHSNAWAQVGLIKRLIMYILN
jgi:hypothetical protein